MTPGPGVSRTSLPQGFTCSGLNSGVRRYRPDLGLIVSEVPCITAGVFTQNECKAAPILFCQEILPSREIKAIVTNSGQANAATGAQGLADNLKMAQTVAQNIGCHVNQVLTASTGPIGVPLDIDKIVRATPELVNRLGGTAEAFALAILTTDLVPKTVSTEVELSGGRVSITGLCKGSGMIHPNMGTMLGYFLTDVRLSLGQAVSALQTSTHKSFNMISVDGESSTNDCAFLMANGMSHVSLQSKEDVRQFQKALDDVAIFLAKSIARDGEGSTKLIEVEVIGSPKEALARTAARGLVMSPLVKTAIHGCDPNWGRILARLGADKVPVSCLEKMSLWLQGYLVYEKGQPQTVDLKSLRESLRSDTVTIRVDLHSGTYQAMAWGCDLSKKYVEINAEYMT